MTTCATCDRCFAAEKLSAHDSSAGRDLPVRPLEAPARDLGRPRADAPRVGRARVPWLLARGCRRSDLLQGGPRPAVRHPPLFVAARRATTDPAARSAPCRVSKCIWSPKQCPVDLTAPSTLPVAIRATRGVD